MLRKHFIMYLLFVLFIGTVNSAAAQGIHLTNNGKIKITNSAYLVINTSSTNGIKQTGGGGVIISEGETNRVKWNVGTAVGVYTVPFRDNDGVDVPVTINKTTSGTEMTSGSFILSTYSTDAENSAWPSDVTNMDGSSGDNSYETIDRFWIIDADDYSAKPDLTLTIGYDAGEISSPNTITESNLMAQRFNSSTNSWIEHNPVGTGNTVNKTVSAIDVSGAEFYKTWTLVDNSSVLPIRLVDFSYKCLGEDVQINWATASETNNNLFLIEKTGDVQKDEWEMVTTINGAGNSNEFLQYSIIDHQPNHNPYYYRLKQIDYDGSSTYSEIISIECDHHKKNVIVYKDGTRSMLQINSAKDADYSVSLYSLTGQKLWTKKISVPGGCNGYELELNDPAVSRATYLLVLESSFKTTTRKVQIN